MSAVNNHVSSDMKYQDKQANLSVVTDCIYHDQVLFDAK